MKLLLVVLSAAIVCFSSMGAQAQFYRCLESEYRTPYTEEEIRQFEEEMKQYKERQRREQEKKEQEKQKIETLDPIDDGTVIEYENGINAVLSRDQMSIKLMDPNHPLMIPGSGYSQLGSDPLDQKPVTEAEAYSQGRIFEFSGSGPGYRKYKYNSSHTITLLLANRCLKYEIHESNFNGCWIEFSSKFDGEMTLCPIE